MDAADEADETVEEVRGGVTVEVKDGLIHLTSSNVVPTRAVDKRGRFRTEEIPGSGAGRAGTVVLTPVEAKQLRRRLDAAIVDAER